MWFKPNRNGLIVLAAALPFAAILVGMFTTVRSNAVVASDGTVLEQTVRFPTGAALFFGGIAFALYPASMAVGRKIPARSAPSVLRSTPWLLSIMPTTCLFLLCVFILYAKARLGFWPSPYNPDPKDIGLSLGLLVLFWPLLMLVSAAGLAWLSVRAKVVMRSAGAFVAGLVTMGVSWAVFGIVIKYDPGRFMEWLAD